MAYTAPIAELVFTLEEVAGLAEARNEGAAGDLGADDTLAILTEAGRFAEEALAPLNAIGDRTHARRDGREIITPPGWREAYDQWIEGGWGSLTGDPAYGGQGLPMALQVAATDIWNQANAAFALNPLLTIGAVEAIQAHGSDALKARYLPNLIAGRWTGTMNLTEPNAGSDLGDLKTRATPQDDGSYRLFGQKIYITYGEHDLAENIIHLVLARLPDAPAGTRGISLFLVPKFMVGADGAPGERNDVACVGIEGKLGINASPTCTMAYGADGDGAVGYLVGAPNKGLAAMFTMMNNARVQVGTQGASIAERAFQQALAYAGERRQGRATGQEGAASIVHHPDVKRMLLAMRASTRAARAICYACAVAIDRGRTDPFYRARADLLTPVAKAFATDIGVEVASLGVQVHGGMGFIEETGAAQHYRDARIFPIYEGTNGIQAIDLVRRKLAMEDGAVLAAYLAELQEIADAARGHNTLNLAGAAATLDTALAAVATAADTLRERLGTDVDATLAGASPFLRALGLTAGGAYLIKAALRDTEGGGARAQLARFFADTGLAAVPGQTHAATEGAADVVDAVLA
ncbi:acyl-CoA dehydrogenase [Acuticoccus sp. MNP-M23]|uniref:acyl-CoA dehydrogenase n=1 Tax=Acuticoccus sp. MNP-M23 TaxID=3072793 RepID=UPI002815EB5B|nr:acyl-CoA dehydrogenase [Acuticoccus sp. MNP-M23]WMS43330.1 acyl-CoA dehydrogenase [Acuticoccus sp. MNP-M23]